MTKTPTRRPSPTPVTGDKSAGERIAKVLARAGVASRRSAETIIAEGRVSVNGAVIDSPALNVTPRDKITVDGQPLGAKEPTRVWLYNKPLGLVTSERDEKGRATVFDNLPEGMPRVMSVGRLDLNSEGLLLLTNDGELKRRLELPSTGWLRKYRVRVNGRPDEAQLAPLKAGLTIDGERFQPMMVSIDRQQGANAWLSVGIREGKNREIRRALDQVGLTVNRLIRIAYGPFQLGNLAAGEVEELRPRVLRDQLGLAEGDVAEGRAAPTPQKGAPQKDMGAKGAARRVASQGAAPQKAAPQKSAPQKSASQKAAQKDAARPAAKTPARAPKGATSLDGLPLRKSWGSKSHGGPRKNAEGETVKPKSWGTKSARATGDTAPRKPPRPPK